MKSILTLTALALVAASCLALAHWYTDPRIERNRELEKILRLDGIADVSDMSELCEKGIVLEEFQTKGYGGTMTIVIAFKDESIVGVRVVDHQETPGFGDVLKPDNWIGRFGKESTQNIDVVTRATTTTRAVLRTIQNAVSSERVQVSAC